MPGPRSLFVAVLQLLFGISGRLSLGGTGEALHTDAGLYLLNFPASGEESLNFFFKRRGGFDGGRWFFLAGGS